MNSKTEKKRCSNFSSFEINLLIKLVEERRDILKCPKLDAITVEKRNAAWKEITQIFNSNNAVIVFRNEEKLKKKYSNIRCERNKIGKQSSKLEDGTQTNEIAQANDNAVAEIVVKKENAEGSILHNALLNKKTAPIDITMDESNKLKEELTESSDITDEEDDEDDSDDGEMPIRLNENEKMIQLYANKLLEVNNNIAIDKSKLDLEMMAFEHKGRMKYTELKHANEMKRIEFQRMKHRQELDLLNMELAFKRKRFHKIDKTSF